MMFSVTYGSYQSNTYMELNQLPNFVDQQYGIVMGEIYSWAAISPG